LSQFSKILVPVDGSDQSMAAADRAIQLAKQHKSELVLVTLS
jgi:nucleotide-binding universal stress UspA family protein